MLRIPNPTMKKSQHAILNALAINGSCYGYELYKKAFRAVGELGQGLSDKTVYTELKELKAKGFVITQESRAKTEKREKGRPAELQYSLTLLGLSYVLGTTTSCSYSPIGPVLAKWSYLVPTVNSMLTAAGKDFYFGYNLAKSFGDLVAIALMDTTYFFNEIREEVIVFDLIYHFYDMDLRPPFLGLSIFSHFKPIFLACPDFKKRTEAFAKILWLDNKWRTLMYEERKLLFEQSFEEQFRYVVPNWNEDLEKLRAKEVYQELQTALAQWPITFKQFLKLKVLHEIWLVKEGEFGQEYRNQI